MDHAVPSTLIKRNLNNCFINNIPEKLKIPDPSKFQEVKPESVNFGYCGELEMSENKIGRNDSKIQELVISK